MQAIDWILLALIAAVAVIAVVIVIKYPTKCDGNCAKCRKQCENEPKNRP